MEKTKRKDETEVRTAIVDLEDGEKANEKSLIILKEINAASTRPGANELRSEDLQPEDSRNWL